jgi:hypothetical protein
MREFFFSKRTYTLLNLKRSVALKGRRTLISFSWMMMEPEMERIVLDQKYISVYVER